MLGQLLGEAKKKWNMKYETWCILKPNISDCFNLKSIYLHTCSQRKTSVKVDSDWKKISMVPFDGVEQDLMRARVECEAKKAY